MREAFEAVRQSVREAVRDNLAGQAAKVAYYFFLSFFPLLLSLFALAGLMGAESALRVALDEAAGLAPEAARRVLESLAGEMEGQSRPGLLSLTLLLTLWSASSIFAALTDGLNVMYDLDEDRGWWRRRALALIALLAAYTVIVPTAVILLAGPGLVELPVLVGAWAWARWPAAFLVLVAALWIIYLLLPNRSHREAGREVLVGAAVGAALWTASTFLFRLYVLHFGSYEQTYGFFGGIIVVLVWLYLAALTILFGGEVAATLEQRAHPAVEVGGDLPERELPL